MSKIFCLVVQEEKQHTIFSRDKISDHKINESSAMMVRRVDDKDNKDERGMYMKNGKKLDTN